MLQGNHPRLVAKEIMEVEEVEEVEESSQTVRRQVEVDNEVVGNSISEKRAFMKLEDVSEGGGEDGGEGGGGDEPHQGGPRPAPPPPRLLPPPAPHGLLHLQEEVRPHRGATDPRHAAGEPPQARRQGDHGGGGGG